ncbi:MAG: carboxypeptidase-like regulatory domain-containing protein [Bacteroidales bacterium]|nr:carboxypeptidase-like regulatory domain-containing protein [Bacteroidales bacterium]
MNTMHNNLLRSILFVVFLCMATLSFSQKIFSGRIVDADTKEAVVKAYVENSSKHLICESNSDGRFEIYAELGDTLVFSSIGYFWAKHIVSDEHNLVFHLAPQVYEIGTVLKMFPYSYEELTRKVLSMKPVEDTLKLNLEHEPFLPINTHQAGQLNYTIDGALTALYNATNRHARNAVKAAELLNHKENILIINKKFNKQMVVEMTNIPDEYFDRFITFCDFSDDFLLNTSEFQIIMAICFKYDCFVELYPELKNSLN